MNNHLAKGIIPNEEVETLSYETYWNEDIYPHAVTVSMRYEDEYDYTDLRINAPDGEYQVAEFTFNWDKKDAPNRWYVSDTLVKVKDGVLDLATLVLAAAEVREQHRYHGRFLEEVEYQRVYGDRGFLVICWGS